MPFRRFHCYVLFCFFVRQLFSVATWTNANVCAVFVANVCGIRFLKQFTANQRTPPIVFDNHFEFGVGGSYAPTSHLFIQLLLYTKHAIHIELGMKWQAAASTHVLCNHNSFKFLIRSKVVSTCMCKYVKINNSFCFVCVLFCSFL